MSEVPSANTTTVPCRLKVTQFSACLSDTTVHYCVLKLQDSFFLWIGSSANLGFSNLSMALQTRYPTLGNVTASRIMGDLTDTTSSAIAARLSKRTGCQVFVSCNLPQADPMLLKLVEERLAEELKVNADAFVTASEKGAD